MATVSIALPPVHPLTMANRRAPLANVPNAINSPFRSVAATASGKRTRAQAGDQRDVVIGQPPHKKQAVEALDDDEENLDPRKRRAVTVIGQDKLDEPFSRRKTNAQPTELQQKLAAARDRRAATTNHSQQQLQTQQRVDRTQKAVADNNLESIRQWQRHYRKQFPQFAFYFESVPEDARLKTSAQFKSLGAQECRFFSKDVTHVITTRPMPVENAHSGPDDASKNDDTQLKTVRPSALTQDQRRTTDLLDANLQRRAQQHIAAGIHDVDPRRLQGSNIDMLVRAREMGIKIWALEKLQRVLRTMLETDTGEQGATVETRDTGVSTRAALKSTKDVDLEKLLRNEKVNGPTDRDMNVAAQDMVQLKGCYIYIHDMDERTKPVMARDYAKPAIKEQGKWPQFRLTGPGRCPFIEDPSHTNRLQQQGRDGEANTKAQQELATQRKTRAASNAPPPPALIEEEATLRRSPRKAVQQARTELSKPLEPPKTIPAKRQSSLEIIPLLFGSAHQQSFRGAPPRMIGGEPVASGLQQSNITSAIRSQVISSAAISSTAPGFSKRATDSKEVSALKRKVLERGGNTAAATSVTSTHSMPSSYMNDMRAALNEPQDPPPRAAKRRAQETLGVVHEDEEEGSMQCAESRGGARAAKKRKPVEKEAKAGYCENCRDKFDDFDDHVNSRKHRKFALEPENWKELDELLSKLKRPHKL